MSSSDKELEAQLLESGNKLVEPPSDVDELLPLLDRIENCLSKVEQSPAESMQTALSPSLQALVDDKLLRHSDTDVKVAVASCISEITRITAPEAPYDDDQMKEVFQLIVSSFEGLDDNTSRSYSKRTSILETVAKVRSCVVMLDLECDALILEMFQHFLKAIRDHHPENVFSSMETIMTLVLEESEDISVELLTPLLASVKNDDKEVLPISRRLGEKVLESCAAKVKPYLVQALKTLNIALDDYSNVVATICQGADDDGVVQNEVQASDENMAGESKSVKPSLDTEAQDDKEVATGGASIENVDPSIDGSPQSAVSNGITQTGGDDSLADSGSLKKQDDHPIENSKNLDASSKADLDSTSSGKAIDTEEKPEQSISESGEKDSSSMKSAVPSECPSADNEKVEEDLPDQEGQSDDSRGSPREGPSGDAAVPLENDKGSDVKPSSPKELESESANAASVSASGNLPDEVPSEKTSVSPSGNLPDEVPSKKTEPQEMDSSSKETAPPADDVSKKVADVTSDSEARPSRRAGKKVPAVSSNENKATTEVEASAKDVEATSDSEKKPLKQSSKKVDGGSKAHGSSAKQAEDKKKPARGKTVSEKDGKKASAKDNTKDMIASPKSSGKPTKDEDKFEETPKTTNSKRKRTTGKAKESGFTDFGHSMVGSKIKVWWPDDKAYYDGVIESFDSARKKHKVLYTDGDIETLNLRKERWEFIGGGSGSDEEEETGQSSPDASAEMPLKKKTKTKSDVRTKQKKIDASPKKVGGGAASSKSKATTPKSARGGKSDSKSKDDSTKSVGKSEDAVSSKSKDNTLKSGGSKSATIVFKSSGKSKNTDSQTPKAAKSKDETSTPSKSKQATPKAVKPKSSTPKAGSASKDKPHLSSGKSNANGTGKAKSGSSKVKESESIKEDSADSEKLQELTKVKLPNPAKRQGSDTKSGKKRRRGVKG